MTSRRFWAVASAVVVASAAAVAQVPGLPGHVAFTLAGLGGSTAVEGEGRLPVLPQDASLQAGALRVHAVGRRGVVRDFVLVVPGATVGRREAFGEGGAALTVQLEGRQPMEVEQGWVELAQLVPGRAQGTFEATLTLDRVPTLLRGRFDARFARP